MAILGYHDDLLVCSSHQTPGHFQWEHDVLAGIHVQLKSKYVVTSHDNPQPHLHGGCTGWFPLDKLV